MNDTPVLLTRLTAYKHKFVFGIFCLGVACSSQADEAPIAKAPETKSPDLTITGSATFVSDYIWRGLTQTWGDPALQVGLEAVHESGLYAGVWGSNVSSQWIPGANLEIDAYGGYRGQLPVDGLGYDIGAVYVYYPNGNYKNALNGATFKSSSANTLEMYAAVSYKWLALKYGRTLTKFYGWNTDNSGVGIFNSFAPSAGVTGDTTGSSYIEANLSIPLAESWILSGQLGHQYINNSRGLDWSYYKAGITKSFAEVWSANVSYSMSSEPDAFKNYASLTGNNQLMDIGRSRLLVSVGRSF